MRKLKNYKPAKFMRKRQTHRRLGNPLVNPDNGESDLKINLAMS